MGSNRAPAVELQVAHVRQLGVPHLVVAFDAKVEEACRKYSILYHRDDEGTAEGCASLLWRLSLPTLFVPDPSILKCLQQEFSASFLGGRVVASSSGFVVR